MRPALREQIFARDGHRCLKCGCTGSQSRPLSIDHIHPRCRGGGDDPSNLQTLCRSCNSAKAYSDRSAEQLPTDKPYSRHRVLRLSDELSAQVDARANDDGLTRQPWMLAAIEWVLSQPLHTVTTTEEF